MRKSTKKSSRTLIIIIIAAVIAVIAAVTTIMILNSDSQKIKRYMSAADKYMDEEEYDQAIAMFKSVLEIDSKNVEAYLGIADAYQELAEEAVKKDKLEKAEKYYNKAIDILEKGYKKTDDEDIADRIDDLKEEMRRLMPMINYEEAAPAVEEAAPAVEEAAPAVEEADPAAEIDPVLEAEIYENYREYLWNNYIPADENDEYYSCDVFESPETGFRYESPRFCFTDINDDGYRDIIVSGMLGLRIKEFSEIYMYYDGTYICIPEIDGTINQCGRYGYLYGTDYDTADAGAIQYESEMVYELDGGNLYTVLEKDMETIVYDSATDTSYEDNPIETVKYYEEGDEISEREYTSLKNDYIFFKELDYVELTFDNIEGYVN